MSNIHLLLPGQFVKRRCWCCCWRGWRHWKQDRRRWGVGMASLVLPCRRQYVPPTSPPPLPSPSHSPHPAQDLALERGYRWLILRPGQSDGRGKNLSQPAIRVDFSMEVHKVGYMEVRIQCRDQIRVLALRLTAGKKKTVFDKWVPPGPRPTNI